MTILLLGGTADARKIASVLHQQGVRIQYSVAGLVRQPVVPCEIVSGGFSRYGGLANYIRSHQIRGVVDATHPYARMISATAADAATQNQIPCIRFLRPGWNRQVGDQWTLCRDWEGVMQKLYRYQRPFFTAGQLPYSVIGCLRSHQVGLVRTAVTHKMALPVNCHWIQAIGPFSVEGELNLMSEQGIDVLITKNSGGEATIAKILAARQLSLPVLMIDRPQLKPADFEFYEPDSCIKHCLGLFA